MTTCNNPNCPFCAFAPKPRPPERRMDAPLMADPEAFVAFIEGLDAEHHHRLWNAIVGGVAERTGGVQPQMVNFGPINPGPEVIYTPV